FDTTQFKSTPYVEDTTWIGKNSYIFKKGIPFEVWNKLISRTFINDHNLKFREDISIAEDLHWMYYCAKYLHSIAFVFEITYIHYYNNEGSLMTILTENFDALNYKKVLFDCLINCDKKFQKQQLKLILTRFSLHKVYSVCTIEELYRFVDMAIAILKEEKQYRSLFLLYLWRSLYPIKNVKKVLRFSYEVIG
ncbi:hypothetical protein, partial [Pseudobutyrivibrio sp.]|uniref:hypothetical protein n=1 Tax=Pseudobutyrivibrio sp. TaxID=2014367 RepID=UPI003863D33F